MSAGLWAAIINVGSGDFWRFTQYGTRLIAVNANDAPQYIDVDAGANFAVLTGSPPQAKNVSVVGDFLVMSGLTTYPYRVQWSGINDSTIWTVGTSLSDTQDFADGGKVTGVAGGETGYILQEYAIRRMTFLPGSDYVFTFERVVDGKGCLSSYGYATVAGTVYFIAEDGFYSYNAQGLNPIGAQRVNRWFLSNCDTARLNAVLCVADPYRPRIFWAFYSTAAATTFDRLMIYDWQLNKWTYAEVSAQIWGGAASPGIGLDSITGTLESQTYSFDSRLYLGGRPTIAAIDASKQLSFLEGSAMAATIETQEFEPAPGARAFMTEVEPHIDTTAAQIRVATRERYADNANYSNYSSMQVTGRCPVRVSGRLHRIEATIPANTTWNHAIGIDYKAVKEGVR